MKYIDTSYDQGTKLFPNTVNGHELNKLLDFVKLDEAKELGETLGTTAGGISAPILVRLLCKRPFGYDCKSIFSNIVFDF